MVFQDTMDPYSNGLWRQVSLQLWVVLNLRDYNTVVYMYQESNPLLSGEISLPISLVKYWFPLHTICTRPGPTWMHGWETCSCHAREDSPHRLTKLAGKITIIFHKGNISQRCLNKNISREAYNTLQCQALHASLWYWLLFGMQQLVLPLIHSHKPRVRSICFPNILTTFREQLPLLSSVQRNTSLDV